MVYQIKLEHRDAAKRYGIKWEDVKKRRDAWTYAVGFYSLAFSMAILNACMFFPPIWDENKSIRD